MRAETAFRKNEKQEWSRGDRREWYEGKTGRAPQSGIYRGEARREDGWDGLDWTHPRGYMTPRRSTRSSAAGRPADRDQHLGPLTDTAL